ncbi:cation diffusion facilitator family transporter [Halocatena salina]|uniref:Cation diffusion facilitator family transporter n=1 Tax=Halocatena salina TaxID=2934340 RepID=A0A8T9ZZE6_9EURY|nr:cation diffusion facilitator family transporter [Halocatena salina]UPM42162.1 cation diffusion facilitator family transporter [Halocatena salina]
MNRTTALRRVGLLVLGVNAILVVAKGGVYLATGSIAVGSEAVNSLADGVYSLVVVWGLYVTTQPPDPDHPHGHERIEPFVSLFVALGILIAGVAVLYNAVQSIETGAVAVGGLPAIAVLGGAAGVKYLLYRYCLRMSRTYHSPAIEATALDNRADVLTALAALIGVLGASVGWPVLDPVAGAVVSLGIMYTGIEIVVDNVGYLIGVAPPEELREEIIDRALSHPDVHGVHDVVPHHVGPEVDVSLHLEIEGNRSLTDAHDIETDVVESIRDIPEVDDVFVHLDPKELGEWKDTDDSYTDGTDTNGIE